MYLAVWLAMPRRRALPPPAEDLPTDLAPLPAAIVPHAHDTPLDREFARSAIWHASGNLSHAADLLGTSPPRLANFVRSDPYLQRETSHARQLLADRAEAVLLDSLADENTRLDTAKWLLERRGAERGYASPIKQQPTAVSFQGIGPAQGTKGALQVRWESDT